MSKFPFKEEYLDFEDVLIRPESSTINSRSQVDVTRTFEFENGRKFENITPIIAANMDHTGTIEMARALGDFKMSAALHKYYTVDELVINWHLFLHGHAWISLGLRQHEYDNLLKFNDIVKALDGKLNICLDIANGHISAFEDLVKKTRNDFPKAVIMAGNAANDYVIGRLFSAGADIVKIGIGPGSVCTTRKIAGVGVPQLSLILEAAKIKEIAHWRTDTRSYSYGKRYICADGGCKVIGDISKAFVAGADFVMLGSMFAGHKECRGEVLTKRIPIPNEDNGIVYRYRIVKTMRFYGMASAAAQEEHGEFSDDYRTPEGKEVIVPYKRNVEYTVRDILGGIRSAASYIGAHNIEEMSKGHFVHVRRQVNGVFGNE